VEHLAKWEFLGPLFKAKANFSWDDNQGWSGSFGVCGYMTSTSVV
jgi:hypothetical protein